MRATTVLTAVDAYPDQREIEVYHLGSAIRSALSGLFEDSRRVDFLFADMSEGMFNRGYIFTVSDMNRLRLALGSCVQDGAYRKGRQAQDASQFINAVLNVEPFHSDAFRTVFSAANTYMEGGR